DIPLIIRLPGMPQVARGVQVRLELLRWDEVDLTIEARLLEIATPAAVPDDETTTSGSEADAGSVTE
ncbi:MAG: ribonuclease, partial [Noviherbaspirillum sp.]|nr:ribonuclease [Noviherbaspirillum sp.]